MPATNGNSSRQTVPGAESEIDPPQASTADTDLSGRARPDVNVRLARIALLQHAIASGTYCVPAGTVAEKVVERLLRDPAQGSPAQVRPGTK